jgi:hypothetical protein
MNQCRSVTIARMRRSALREFFTRVLPVSAPLLLAGCCPPGSTKVAFTEIAVPDGGLTDAGCEEACANGLPSYNHPQIVGCRAPVRGYVECIVPGCVGGRAPADYTVRSGATVEDHLAAVAELEAASVIAFEQLAAELTAHGAPSSFVTRARSFADDERRHARTMRALARRSGANPRRVSVKRAPIRSLVAVACENAVEGCVRETWGALLGALQTQRAADPRLRAAMARIAPDELRHAELAWEVDAWARRRLGKRARGAVIEARQEAGRALAARADGAITDEAASVLGLPSKDEARKLAGEALRSLWS